MAFRPILGVVGGCLACLGGGTGRSVALRASSRTSSGLRGLATSLSGVSRSKEPESPRELWDRWLGRLCKEIYAYEKFEMLNFTMNFN